MKKKKKLFVALLACLCIGATGGLVAGCGPSGQLQFTVNFNTNGGSTIAPVKVDKNTRVSKPADPTRGSDEFLGWYTDNETFLEEWNFDVNIVTKNTTLYANWLIINNYPSEVALDTSRPFSSTLTWKQKDIAESTTTFTVTVGNTEKPGTWQYDQETKTVTFTFSDTVLGGEQAVKIQTTRTDTSDPIQDTTTNIKFKGNGTEADPYRIYKKTAQTDLLAVTNGRFNSEDKFFQLEEDIIFESNINDKNAAVFKGVFDGNDKIVNFSGNTNSALFYELENGATVKDVKFQGTVTTENNFFAPAVTHNKGTISGVYTLMQIVSEVGTIGTAFSGNIDDLDEFVGGGAGVAGVNYATGLITDCTMKSDSSSNTLKVANGGGGMASINYGTISNCSMQACIGAYNSKEVGKSNEKYSFLGGMAGYNYGTIEYCELTGTGKILAQRYQDKSAAKNIAIGGMAGINGATGVITNCSNDALRVHGDHYVGGIAGINQGTITTCEVGFTWKSTAQITYVGGRNWVGGIVGKTEGTGTVSNCLFAGNVYAHNTTDDATKQFAIAENANNCVYVDHNLNSVKTATADNVGTVPTPSALTAPQGTNNIAISVASNSTFNHETTENIYKYVKDSTVDETDDDYDPTDKWACYYFIDNDEDLLNCLNTGIESRFAYDELYGIRLNMTMPAQS